MYYDDDASFTPPKNVNASIWRYMTFTQFVFLLERRCLHFSRPDAFPDQFEGAMPRRFRESLTAVTLEGIPNVGEVLKSLFRQMRENTCVNCWHANKHESEAMWRLYLKNDEGIAFRSTFARLVKSFDDDPDIAIHAGTVKYRDYDRETVSATNHLSLLMHKRMSFAHEHEIRAIAIEVSTPEGVGYIWKHQPIARSGKDIPVDLSVLVEAIYVSPNKQSWFKKLVEDVVKRYGFDFPVMQSDLEKDAVW